MQKRYNWAEIQAYYDDRHTIRETRERFGFNLASWTKAVKRGDVRSRKRGHLPRPELYAHNRYDWAEVQRYHDAGHSRIETMRHFGFCAGSWTKAIERGDIVARPRNSISVPDFLATARDRATVKRHLLRAGILQNRCAICALTDWRGRPIAMQIDHINGDPNDHRLENLRMLCPNCHSQTETFAGKNCSRKRQSRVV